MPDATPPTATTSNVASSSDSLQGLLKLVHAATQSFSGAQVQAAWEASRGSHLSLTLFDPTYNAVPEQLWLRLCQFSHTNRLTYVRGVFDCNSFADALKGVVKADFGLNGIGFVADISGKHAYNAVICSGTDANGKPAPSIAFVEPQRDALAQLDSGFSGYQLKSGIALF